jgi:hypothetical protein
MRALSQESVNSSVFDNNALRIGRTFARVFENKNGSSQLAKEPRTKPRNRHFAAHCDIFRDQAARMDIEASYEYKISSFEHTADYTKRLAQEPLETIRCWCPAKMLGDTDLREFQVAPSSEKSRPRL